MYNDDDDLLFSKNVDHSIKVGGGGIDPNPRKGKSGRTCIRGSVIMENTVEIDIGENKTKNVVKLFDDLFSLDGLDNDEVDRLKKKWHEFNVSDMGNLIFVLVCCLLTRSNQKML